MAQFVSWYKKFNTKQKTGFLIGLFMLAILPLSLLQVQRQVSTKSKASEATQISVINTANNNTPILLTKTLPDGKINQNYSIVLRGKDQDSKDILKISAFGLPAGFKVTNCQQDDVEVSCLVIGTPTKTGTYRVYITLRDSNNASSQFRYQLIIK